jgi:hypothetical protein
MGRTVINSLADNTAHDHGAFPSISTIVLSPSRNFSSLFRSLSVYRLWIAVTYSNPAFIVASSHFGDQPAKQTCTGEAMTATMLTTTIKTIIAGRAAIRAAVPARTTISKTRLRRGRIRGGPRVLSLRLQPYSDTSPGFEGSSALRGRHNIRLHWDLAIAV